MKLLLAVAAGFAGYCYYLGLQKRRQVLPREEVNRWESEGGNVPSVATPSPQGVHVHPAGDPAVRH